MRIGEGLPIDNVSGIVLARLAMRTVNRLLTLGFSVVDM
jgi:hypothetical protein